MIDLGDNTSRFGAPPAALRVLADRRADDANAYPSPEADALREAIADLAGVAPEAIVTGCGSDDVIDCAIRAFGAEGGRIVYPAPTFSMLPSFAANGHMRAVPVPFRPDGGFDAAALLSAAPRIIYLCAPNNPTGHVPGGDFQRLLDGPAELVILDEAYAEFAGAPGLASAPRHPRLLVTRTLSKAWGLAGLRIGYGVGAAALIERIARVRGPYRIGRLAERAAVAALREDHDWMRAHVAGAVASRTALARTLEALSFRPLPSEANFVLVPLPGAVGIAQRMHAAGVRVRAFPALPGIGDALRITVGPPDEMDAAVQALVGATTTADATSDPTESPVPLHADERP